MKQFVLVQIMFLLCSLAISQEKRVALVIGNDEYEKGLLMNSVNDARAIEKALIGLGFTVQRLENLGQKEMTQAIDDFGKRLKYYDVALFFYAGHGIQSKGFNYLIPIDAKLLSESDVEYNCVRADRILGKMEDARTKVNIVILDACRDNPFEKSWTRSARGQGLASMMAPIGSIIAFATSPGKTGSDGSGENGLYTSGILNYINEPGITAIQMFQKVNAFVLKKSDYQQQPWVSTSLTGDFYLLPGSNKSVNAEVLSGTDLRANTVSTEKSVIVLPFKNLTGKPDQDYLVQGQNDVLISELSSISQVKPLRVLSEHTALAFANTTQPIPQIAGEIDVDYIVEGSVLNAGDSISLKLRLIQALPDEKVIWSSSYVSKIPDLLKLYNNIAGQIVKKIGFDLSAENLVKLPSPGKVNPETYKEYIRGMTYLNQLTPESVKKGFDHLKKAVEIDPADPYANTYLALGYLNVAHSSVDPGDALTYAEAAAFRSIKIDTTIAETYSALAEISFYDLWKFDDAEKYFKKALSLDPNLAIAHYHYAWLLAVFGRMDEAVAEHKLAERYDPLNPDIVGWLAYMYSYAGNNEEALRTALKSLEIQKDHPIGLYSLSYIYSVTGKNAEALETYRKLASLYPEWRYSLGLYYVSIGKKDEAEKILHSIENEKISPWNALALADLNAALGNKDEALKWLNFEPHHAFILWAATDPTFNCCHGDPGWDQFITKMNLPQN
jgi:TolB-like protein/Tfp pilus assembly protein PilF